jgi:hypothetical protein
LLIARAANLPLVLADLRAADRLDAVVLDELRLHRAAALLRRLAAGRAPAVAGDGHRRRGQQQR